MTTFSHNDLIPGRKTRALTKEVRRFVLDLGDTADLWRAQAERKWIYSGNDFFEACCARKSWEAKCRVDQK